MDKYYITNDLAVDYNRERKLFDANDGYTVFAAPQIDEEECFLIYAVSNSDPYYLGWYCPDSEFGEIDEISGELGHFNFTWDEAIDACRDIAEQFKQYDEQDTKHGFVTDVLCFDQYERNKELTIDIKLEQEAYPYQQIGEDEVEYIACGIASNGMRCFVSWYVPAEMDDVSFFDWNDVAEVDFRY